MPKEKEMKLAIGLGSELNIKIEGIDERIKAILVGMEPSNYLIIRMQLKSKFRSQIDKGTLFTVRYVFMGNVYGFHSLSLGSIKTPFNITFLSYPQTIEAFNLRKVQRVNCYIPATANLHGHNIKGVVTDIGTGGTRFTVIARKVKLQQVNVNDPVSLLLPLLGVEGKQRFQGTIKNINSDTEKVSFGVQFDSLDSRIADIIDVYVKDVLDYQDS